MFVLQVNIQEATHFLLKFKAKHNLVYRKVLEINLIGLKYIM